MRSVAAGRIALIALALLPVLAGCGSSPTHYYALDAQPPAGTAAACHAQGSGTIRVDAVTIPAELDRLQIVRNAGGNRVDIASFDRWAAPLDEQIRRVLSEDLAGRLPQGRVVPPHAPAGGDAASLVAVDIGALDADPSGHVRLAADWSLVKDGKAVLRRNEVVDADGGAPAQGDSGAAATAAAASRALGVLADRIGEGLAQAGDC